MTRPADEVLEKLQRYFAAFHKRDVDRWLVLRFSAVEAALRSPSLEKEQVRVATARRFPAGALAAFHEHNVLYNDPPKHSRLRRVMRALYPSDPSELTPRIAALADDLIARLPSGGVADLHRDFAHPLPVQVICMLLGIGADDVDLFMRWSAVVTRAAEPDFDARCLHETEQVTEEAAARLRELIASPPSEGVFVERLRIGVERGELTLAEAVSLALMSFSAGHETTAGLIGASLAFLSLDEPLQEQLRNTPALVTAAVQEMLRLVSPVQYVEYATTRPCALGDVTLEAGAHLALMFSTANRDPTVFPDPDRFELGRPERHIAFGLGRHSCPGGPLATLEAEIAITALLRRRRFRALVPTIEWADRQFLKGPSRVPCRVDTVVPEPALVHERTGPR